MKKLSMIVLLTFSFAFCMLDSFAQFNRANNKSGVAYRSNYQRMAAGRFHTLEIRNGTLWAWGYNGTGQLGDGTQTDRVNPVQVGSDTRWVILSTADMHSLAIKSDGTLWAWGNNSNGQLGDGTFTLRSSPVQVGTDNKWVSISAGGYHSLALKSDGSLWAWGMNSNGQLGNGSTSQSTTPLQVGTDNKWVSITAGDAHTIAVKSDGTLWAWGRNANGQLGNGTTTQSTIPVQVGTDIKWVSVSACGDHSLALKSDGTIWSWGQNTNGQIGDGTTTNRTSPVQIGSDNKWVSIAAAVSHSVALKSDGTAWAWGINTSGQLGDGTVTQQTSPVQVGSDNKWVSVDANQYHTLGQKSNGTLWAWGQNGDGQLGDGTTTTRHDPVQVSSDNKWITLSAGNWHTLALKSDGSLWVSGSSTYGEIGDGTNTNRHTPVQIGDNKWIGISGGQFHTAGLKSDGTLWAWGWNGYGQVGDGTNVNRNAPVKVGTDNKWVSVSAGDYHTLGIKSDGTLWGFGGNNAGELGDGTAVNTNTPVQIGSDNKWVSVSAGGQHTLGLKSDGTLWAWGWNPYGQIGDGTTTQRNTPVQIGSDTKWVSINAGYSFSTAMKSDGTIWSWGNNIYGQLGDGTNTNRTSPVQIGTDNKWVSVETGHYFSACLKSDGSLWTWGYNSDGELGDGTNTHRNSPYQVTSQANVIVAKAGYHAGVIKSDRTFICMTGYNGDGELGNGTIIDRNTFECVVAPPASVTSGIISPLSLCGGTSVSIPVNVTGTFNAGNTFTAQLSDANGSFASPTNIGTLSATGSGTINGTIPSNITAGTSYRIRVTASNPVINGGDNGSNIALNPGVAASISITAFPAGAICQNTSVTFTAVGVNGGAAPFYVWKRNGFVAANGLTYTSTFNNNDNIVCVMTSNAVCATGSPATSNTITMTVNQPGAPFVTINANPFGSICATTPVTFTASPSFGGTSPSFQWKINGVNVGTGGNTFTSSSLADGDSVQCVLTSSEQCAYNNPDTSLPYVMQVMPSIFPSISISASQTTICAGNPATFTATTTDVGIDPQFYTWKINGVTVANGFQIKTYTTSSLANNDNITCEVNALYTPCAMGNPAASNSITMTVNPNVPASVSISANPAGLLCLGTNVTVTAVPVNGGAVPTYQWKVNGGNVGINSPVYSSASLNSADEVTCQMTSSITCTSPAIANSNTVYISMLNPVAPVITISSLIGTTICQGTNTTFTASVSNGGVSPSFQWKVNGTNAGTNYVDFSASTLADGDEVTCELTTSASCVTSPTATSNSIAMTVLSASVTPSVSISSNPGATVCSGTNVTFTAAPTAGGSSPAYQWKVNGGNAGTNSVSYSISTLNDGDVVSCELTSSETCVTSAIANSNTINMTVNPLPVVTAYDVSGCAGSAITLSGSPAGGLFSEANPYTGTTTTYTYSYTDGNGCSNISSPADITVNPLPTVTAGNVSGCAGSAIALSGSPAGGSFSVANPYSGSNTSYTYSYTDGNGCYNTSATANITVNPLPNVTAGNVSGCTGSAIALSGTPAGGTFSAANPYTGSGTTYTYTYTDGNGCTNTSSSATITVNPLPTVSFSGLAASYSVSAAAVTLTSNPAGGTFSGPGISANTFNPSSAGAGGPYTITYSYTDANGCSNTSTHQTTVTNCATPTQPGAISVSGGNAKVCPGDIRSYTTAAATGVTFNWTAPAGATINSGQGTRVISVTYGAGFTASGTVSVVKVNSCGSGPARTLAVTRNNPATPGVITGQTYGVCNLTNVPYSIVNVAGINYSWSFNTAAASITGGQGTNAVSTNFGASYVSGVMSVTATNACGTSPARTLTVKVVPATPVSITGPTSVCANQQGVPYSTAPLASAVSYTWIGPPGSHISDGITISAGVTFTTTSNSVTVNFGSSTGKLNVRGNNACGNGAYKFIVVGFNCREEEQMDNGLTMYPNPTRGAITLEYEAATAENYLMQVLDFSGRKVMEQEGSATEGNNSLHADLSSLAKGVYMIEFKSGSINKKSRVVVQ